MRVGLDISVTNFNEAGPARYSLELLRALRKRTGGDLELVALKAAGFRLPRPGLTRKLFVLYWEWVYCPLILPMRVRQLGLDLLHCTSPLPLGASLLDGRTRVVTTIHDVIPFLYPLWFGRVMGWRLRRWTRCALRASCHLIANSQYTKQSLSRYLGVPDERVTVIYLGWKTSSVAARHGDKSFLLTVGTLEPRKNLSTVLEAYRLLKSRLPAVPPLYVVGGHGWGHVRLKDQVERLGIADSVWMLGYVPDEELYSLYARAEMLIYPSLQEGFGLPPLEAMACGCPVITSNVSSLPEVVGEAGVLVNPLDPVQIADAMCRILLDKHYARELAQAGLARAREFSWERCAEETLTVYRRVLMA